VKILLSVALWGRKYAKAFADYSLASMLAPDNIPKLARTHEVVYHIMTTRKDCEWLGKHPAVRSLAENARIDWDFLEDHGYNPRVLPRGHGGKKYSFLTLLQNVAIAKSLEHDALVFNYADFIWTNGSLTNLIGLLSDGVDAVLSFCLPVDTSCGTQALNAYRTKSPSGAEILDLPPRAGADIAIRCLHSEAKLRYWDGPEFTTTPTYLLWPVGQDGILVRAYHQTILALRVKADDPAYRSGIPAGSLDGHFTTLLAERASIRHAANSDQVMVFSLYDTAVDSRIGGPARASWRGFTREESMRECLRATVSDGQRKFAQQSIEVRRAYDQPRQWGQVAKESIEIIERFHSSTTFDPEEHKRAHTEDMSLQELAARWRQDSVMATNKAILYNWLAVGITWGRLVWLFKFLLGPSRARAMRLSVERLIYGGKR
jgi:hypothetical protein